MTIDREAIARIIDPSAFDKNWGSYVGRRCALTKADDILALISRTEVTGAAGVSDDMVQRAMLAVQDGCDINPKEMRTALEASLSAKPAGGEAIPAAGGDRVDLLERGMNKSHSDLKDALEWALAEIEGRTRYLPGKQGEEQRANALGQAWNSLLDSGEISDA